MPIDVYGRSGAMITTDHFIRAAIIGVIAATVVVVVITAPNYYYHPLLHCRGITSSCGNSPRPSGLFAGVVLHRATIP
jgi:hypothetical protein